MKTIHSYSVVMENVQAAKALLKRIKATDMSGFEEIKAMVGTSLGYVNFLTKLLYVDNADMEEVKNIWRTIKSEPQLVGGFSKPAADLDTTEQFWDEYNKSRDRQLAKRALDELPSAQKSLVSLDNPEDTSLLKVLWQDPDKTVFIKKVSRYKNRQTLVQAMRGFVYNKTSNDFDKVLSNLEGLDIPVLHSDRDLGIIISLVMDWQKLRKVAADTSWCIVSSGPMFMSYLSLPLSLQFVIFNFYVGHPNYRKIGVTTSIHGYRTAHLVDDRRFSLQELTKFLDERGVDVSILYPTRESILDYGMDGLRVEDLMRMFTKEEIFANKKSYDIRDFVFMVESGTDKETIKSMARDLGIAITGPVSSMLKFYTPEEILAMKGSCDINDLISLSDAGVDKQRIRSKAVELGIEIEGPVSQLIKFYTPYELLDIKKTISGTDFAILARAGDMQRVKSIVFDKNIRITGPVKDILSVFSPDEVVSMKDDFTIKDLVDLIESKFDNPLRSDVLEFVKNPKFNENSLAQLIRKRPASIMKFLRDRHGYENTGHPDVRNSGPALRMMFMLMRDQKLRFEDTLYMVNKHTRQPVELFKTLRSIHGELGPDRIKTVINNGSFDMEGWTRAYILSTLIKKDIEKETCVDILEKYLDSENFYPPQGINAFKNTVDELKDEPKLLNKFMSASRKYFSQNLSSLRNIDNNMDKLSFLDYVGVRPPAELVVDLIKSWDFRNYSSNQVDYLPWFRAKGYDMQDPVFLELIAGGKVNRYSGQDGLSGIFQCLKQGVSVKAAKEVLESIIKAKDSSPINLEPGEFDEEIKNYAPEMTEDWETFVEENSDGISRRAAYDILRRMGSQNPLKEESKAGFLEDHLPRLMDAGLSSLTNMLGLGLLLCDIDPEMAEGLKWTGIGDLSLSTPVRDRIRDILFPRRELATFVMSVFLYGRYKEMKVSDETARATQKWLDETFDWDKIGHDGWSVMLVAWRKYDRAKYLKYLKEARSVTDNSAVWYRGQVRSRTNRIVLLKYLLYAVAKDGTDADMREVLSTVRITSAEKRLTETRDLLTGYFRSDFDLDSDIVDGGSFKKVASKLRQVILGEQNESAGHVATTFGSFLNLRG
jgi:hypothetical protein